MITEIEPNFYRITLRMPYRLRHVNAYLIAHGKELALFDTGLNMPQAYETLIQDQYLFVSTDPWASMTAGLVKFSLAINSMFSCWRRRS